MKTKSIFTEVSEMAQKINSMGKPQEGVAYIIAAVDTKEEDKANTAIVLAGSGLDVAILIQRLLKEESFGLILRKLQAIEAIEALKNLIDKNMKDKPEGKCEAAATEAKED